VSLDTKYRPKSYSDVLGQDASKKVLKHFVAEGKGYQQSYLFAGPHGSGKTTLGRILARALLCDAPVEGEPCDQCDSCRAILEDGSSIDFIEVDAATNSGKAEIKRLLDEVSYTTFSGKRRIYLFDEAHRLSKEALDALLKPLEENAPGSEDKRLVCIFCTTEPEKMRATLISRCAPTFQVRSLPPEVIAERLAYICEQESIECEPEVLTLIAEMTECHIRDALKAIEGVSMLGSVNKENVSAYLHLDLNATYLDVLEALGKDLALVHEKVGELVQRTSPKIIYERLAEISMLAYSVGMGVGKSPSYWDSERLKKVGQERGVLLLGYASRLARRPGQPSPSMLLCDLAHLHHGLTAATTQVVVQGAAPVSSGSVAPSPTNLSPPTTAKTAPAPGTLPPVTGVTAVVDERAVRQRSKESSSTPHDSRSGTELDTDSFCRLLALRIAELDEAERGPKGRPHMDRSRTE